MNRRLIILLGPTAVGKTDYSISLAQKYDSPIISCDSRQFYREMTIGTAVPDASQLAAVKHFFVQDRSVTEPLTAGHYEIEAIKLIEDLFSQGHETLVMTGGSMFYIDAICKGMADVPDADPVLRAELNERLHNEGSQALAEELKSLDPIGYSQIDRSNGARVLRALEVCITSGKPWSSFKVTTDRKRDFTIEKIGLTRPREELYARINRRVEIMMEQGLIDEARSLYGYRDLSSLQTVGYREIFAYLDSLEGRIPDHISLEKTVADIQSNTRNYARRQITWWRRDKDINWIELQH